MGQTGLNEDKSQCSTPKTRKKLAAAIVINSDRFWESVGYLLAVNLPEGGKGRFKAVCQVISEGDYHKSGKLTTMDIGPKMILLVWAEPHLRWQHASYESHQPLTLYLQYEHSQNFSLFDTLNCKSQIITNQLPCLLLHKFTKLLSSHNN